MTQDEINAAKDVQYTRIMNAENELAAADYRDHKNHEALLDFMLEKYPELRLRLPYDAEQLHLANNKSRDIINDAQDKIKRLDAITPDIEEPEQMPPTSD